MTSSSGFTWPSSSSISCPSTAKRSTKIHERPARRRDDPCLKCSKQICGVQRVDFARWRTEERRLIRGLAGDHESDDLVATEAGNKSAFGRSRAARARRGGRAAGRVGRPGARAASLAHPVLARFDTDRRNDLRRDRTWAGRLARAASARAARGLLRVRGRRNREPCRPGDSGKGGKRGVHSRHGRAWNPPDGK